MSGEIEATARGHLAADAAVKLVNGQEVTELRIAVGVRRKDKTTGEWQDHRTDWVDVVVWGTQVGPCSKLTKGQLIEVRGSLEPRAYLSNAGDAVAATRITARSVTVVPRLTKTSDANTAAAA